VETDLRADKRRRRKAKQSKIVKEKFVRGGYTVFDAGVVGK
jgi:hypothetical protein